MKPGHLKGAILEYIVRNILKSCGFKNVKPDGLYIYEDKGLFLVNGKGASHDTDVLMDPPVQIPFSYPMRIIFECKSYDTTVGLAIVRNAAGMREDINNFEIVTKDFLMARKKNRTKFAVENRNRHMYQVGVVSLDKFSAPATEFAINNKIPLLSIAANFNQYVADKINSISLDEIEKYSSSSVKNLYAFFKDRNGDLFTSKYESAREILYDNNQVFQIIHTLSEYIIRNTYVGLLESGQIILLHKPDDGSEEIIFNSTGNIRLKAELHWTREKQDQWELEVFEELNPERRTKFKFFLPSQMVVEWGEFSFSKSGALDLKDRYFSKIMVFNKGGGNSFPLSQVTLDQDWLTRLKSDLQNQSDNESN